WYFLSLFQLLKYFQGDLFLVGTLVIPGAIVLFLFVLPWLGTGPLRPVGHVIAILGVAAILLAAGYLTAQAWVEDQAADTFAQPEKIKEGTTGPLVPNPRAGEHNEPYFSLRKLVAANRYDAEKANAFQKEMEEAEQRAKRAVQLAGDGIPAEGGRYLLRRDPMTKGKELFKLHCGTCHTCGEECKNPNPTASDLFEFGTKQWITGIITDCDNPKYFGLTQLKGGKMSQFVSKARKDSKIHADLDGIADWLAEHPRKDPPGEDDKSKFAEGFRK